MLLRRCARGGRIINISCINTKQCLKFNQLRLICQSFNSTDVSACFICIISHYLFILCHVGGDDGGVRWEGCRARDHCSRLCFNTGIKPLNIQRDIFQLCFMCFCAQCCQHAQGETWRDTRAGNTTKSEVHGIKTEHKSWRWKPELNNCGKTKL